MTSPLFTAPVKQNNGSERAGLGLSFCSITTGHEICDHGDGSNQGCYQNRGSLTHHSASSHANCYPCSCILLGQLKQALCERAGFQPQELLQHHRQQSQAGEQDMMGVEGWGQAPVLAWMG